MNQLFSTSEVAPARRFSYWREMINETFVPLDVAPLTRGGGDRRFSGSVAMRELGELRIAHVSAEPMTAVHARRHVNACGDNDYFLALHVRGVADAVQGGRRATLRAGDFALLDSARPYAIEFRSRDTFEHLIYRLPRSALDARWARAESATALPVGLASDAGKLVAPYLSRLATLGDRIASGSGERLSAAAIDLIATAISIRAGDAASARGARPLLGHVKQRALARIGDPDLGPASVAAASFISVRALHRLFAAEATTFSTFLREERLRRCREDLADARLAHEPIRSIAARWGFRSPAHFTRTFSARYGVSPRAFRQSELRRCAPAAAPRPCGRTARC